jgi:hypothetical protein
MAAFGKFGKSKSTGVLVAALCALAMVLGAGMASAQCVKTADGSGLFTLYAGQSIPVGSVVVATSGGNLVVTYSTTGGWELTEAHLWIGNTLGDMPQTKTGNPIPGKFPYNSGDLGGLTSYTFSVPLSNPAISFSCPSPDVIYFFAAHAAVRKQLDDGTYQTETGWSEGSPLTSKGNWATFSTFTLSCDCGDLGGGKVCETAFAFNSSAATCFNELNFERWGWTNGPLTAGSYEMDIYAGAAQCDTSKGILVGTLSVVYDGTTAVVTYNLEPGFGLEETHLYVGNEMLPKFKQGKNFVQTVSPGQYPYIHETLEGADSDTYTVSISGPIYVIAHAVVCY